MAKEEMADKIRDVRDKTELKGIISGAQQAYEEWCDKHGEEYNQSPLDFLTSGVNFNN